MKLSVIKKLWAVVAGMFIFCCVNTQSHASLASDALLTFISGNLIYTNSELTGFEGSYFSIDYNGDGLVQDNEKGGLVMNQGIILGLSQPTYNQSHAGAVTGSELTSIDRAFMFGGATAMHNTVIPISIFSDDGTGNVLLDFEGWRWDWNGTEDIDWSGDPGFSSDTGYAILSCAIDCSTGDSYFLDYSSHGPSLSGTLYTLHLEGTISSVPVPATVWLFGSGLLGLIGVARRKAS